MIFILANSNSYFWVIMCLLKVELPQKYYSRFLSKLTHIFCWFYIPLYCFVLCYDYVSFFVHDHFNAETTGACRKSKCCCQRARACRMWDCLLWKVILSRESVVDYNGMDIIRWQCWFAAWLLDLSLLLILPTCLLRDNSHVFSIYNCQHQSYRLFNPLIWKGFKNVFS